MTAHARLCTRGVVIARLRHRRLTAHARLCTRGVVIARLDDIDA
ncbi:hypothetical protein ACFFRL_03355 [Agromyces hippuratus]